MTLGTRTLLFGYLAFCRLHCFGLALAQRFGRGRADQPAKAMLQRVAAWRGRSSLIVFAATIGELNAVKPFIAGYREIWTEDRLILLTAQDQYLGAMQAAYPDAAVGLPSFREPWLWARFFNSAMPRLVAFAEGPSLHGHFPLRLELPLPAACLSSAVPLIVVNARLYEKNAPSRIDRFEQRFFGDLLRAAVRHWYTPDENFRDQLTRVGTPAAAVTAVGDLKFDTAAQAGEEPDGALSKVIAQVKGAGGPVLVAGSVNAIDDQRAVIGAWLELKQRFASARLVIAPRYVNDAKVMNELRAFLTAEALEFTLRSEITDETVVADILVVDVFGELRHYYGVADISYVGRNHGLLEPLSHGTPTVAGADWRNDHPSFPLYDLLVKGQAVIQVRDKTDLGATFRRILDEPAWALAYVERARAMIAAHSGAADRILQSISTFLERPAAHHRAVPTQDP